MKATNTDINGRAMLCAVRIASWTARKYDRAETKALLDKHAASPDAARVNKMLLPGDAATYKAAIAAGTEARGIHYAQTLPWSDEGWRLLPSANFMAHADRMRHARAKWETAVDAFISDYPALQEAAKIRLNGMYSDSDYPGAADIRARFAFAVDFSPVPASGDFRLDLPADQLSALETSVTDRVQAAAQDAMRDAWTRLYDAVARIHERLSKPDAIFRDSLIGNARDLCDVLARLNLTQDVDLERMRAEVAASLATADPQTLRDSDRARAEKAAAAQKILDAMRPYAGPMGGAQ